MSADVKVLHNIDEDRSSLCQLLQDCQHLEAETWSDEKICGATEIYELVLATGSDRITATHKMVELYPCPRVKERVDRVTYKGIQAGTTCDLRPNKFENWPFGSVAIHVGHAVLAHVPDCDTDHRTG